MRLRLPHRLSIGSGFTLTRFIPLVVAAFCIFILVIGFSKYIKSKAQATRGADPVAYWGLNEGIGTTIYDSAGLNNGPLGPGSSAPSWKSKDYCLSGSCLWFDGTYDQVDIPSSTAISTNTLSVSFWMRAQPYPTKSGAQTLIAKGDATHGWYINRSGTEPDITLRLDTGTAFNYNKATITGVYDNKWHHIAYTIDHANSQVKGYKDGVLVATDSYTSSQGVGNTASKVEIAQHFTAAEKYQGYLDEIKLYDYVLTADQVRKDAGEGGTKQGAAAVLGLDDHTFLTDGLVGYWNMDEGVGTSIADNSGNGGRSSAFSGNTSWTTGKYGSGLSFDGSDDVVRIPENPGVDLGTTADSYTVSAWFKTNTNYGNVGVIVQKFGLGSYIPFTLRIDQNEKISFTILDYSHSPSIYSTASYSDGQWHNAVGIRNINEKKLYLYVDGVLAANPVTDTTDSSMLNDSDISIGNGTGAAYDGADFNGQIDEVRIYNRVMTPVEVQKLYSSAPGPLAYFPFDEDQGSTVYDKSGNGNTGTFQGTMNQKSWVKGKFGGALSFDGDDYVTADSVATGLLENSGTFEAWVKPRVNQSTNIGGFGASGGGSDVIYLETNVTAFRSGYRNANWPGEGIAQDTDNFTPGTWHHVAATWSSNRLTLYVNGVLKNSSTLTAGLNNQDMFVIGALSSEYITGADPFDGVIDEVKVYNYERNNAQIIEDMNGGHPIGGSPVGSQSLYLSFDEGVGTTAYDGGPLHLDAALGSGISSPIWTSSGKLGKALRFDGTNDIVYIPYNAALLPTDNFSISAWIKRENTADSMIAGVWGPSLRSYELVVWSNNLSLGVANGSGVDSFGLNGTTTLATNTWYHVMATYSYSNKSVNLYINGNLEASSTTPLNTVYQQNVPFTVGRQSYGNFPFKGTIDEVKLYNGVLTADQAKAEYNQGKALVLGANSTQADGTTPSYSAERSYCVPGDTSTCSPPIGEWTFNEGTGSTAFDTSGNGYDAGKFNNFDFNADDGWKKGKFGKAIQLDGVNDNMQVSNTAFALVGGTSSFTISTWVKFDTMSTIFHRILTYRQDASNGYHLAMTATNGGTCPQRFLFEVVKAGTYYSAGCSGSNPIYTTGVWYHVEAVFDGSANTSTVYVNGVKQAGTSVNSLGLGVSNTLTFGSQSTAGTNVMDGYIDDTRIYDYARTPTQIAWDFNKGKPIAWYPFDECSGTNIYDWSGNGEVGASGNTGTLDLGAAGVTTAGSCGGSGAWGNGGTGPMNNSIDFDASDDYVSAPNTRANNITGNITLTAWVNPDGYPGGCGAAPRGGIISKGGIDNNTGYELLYNGNAADNYPLEFNIPLSGTLSVANPFTFGTWYHLAATLDGTNAKIYINGKLRASSSSFLALPPDSSAYALNIGRREPTNNYACTFNGKLDDVRIYNYALTANQIKTVYSNGAVSFH